MMRLKKQFNWTRRYVSDSVIYTMGNCSMRVFSKGKNDKRRGLAVIYNYDDTGILTTGMAWLNRKEAIAVYRKWKDFDRQQAREAEKFKR